MQKSLIIIFKNSISHIAAIYGTIEIVKTLAIFSDLSLRNYDGETPIELSIRYGNPYIRMIFPL